MQSILIDTLVSLLVATAGVWLPILIINKLKRQLYYVYGPKRMLVPAAIGVPVHELSHLLVAILCGHKIKRVAFFKPNSAGGLGFVEHSYRPTALSPFTNLLIGLAPIAGGLIVFGLLTKYLAPDVYSHLLQSHVASSGDDIARYLKETLGVLLRVEWRLATGLWFVLSVCVVTFMTPSGADFRGCRNGFIVTYLLLVAMTAALPEKTNGLFQAIISWLGVLSPVFIVTIVILVAAVLGAYISSFLFKRIGRQQPDA